MLEYYVANKEPTWFEQFKLAVMVGPQIDEDEHIIEVTAFECLMHFFAVPWKVLFAFIPPRYLLSGWPAFIVSLGFIGLVSVVVGEFALLFGCVFNIKTSTTAITLVALGLSLPDTFTSNLAAKHSRFADAAIGHIPGSNSVNVFLGMGISWVIACLYMKITHNSAYIVPVEEIEFSIILFLIASVCCLIVLGLRRCCIGGELGGKGLQRPCSAFILVFLWFGYIIGCTLKAYYIFDFNV